jgi:hypothetical protein
MKSPFKIIPRIEVGKEDWDSFVDSSDEAWLKHIYDFQNALSTWPGRTDISFAVNDYNSAKDIIAVVPLYLLEGKKYKFLHYNIIDSTGGPACLNALSEKHKKRVLEYIYRILIEYADRYKAREINISLSPMAPMYRGDRCPRVNPLLKMGFENALTQTWIINIGLGKDIIWDKMEGRARTAIRKSEKFDIKIRLANELGDLDKYYQLHRETYLRNNIKPHPKAYFESVFKNFLSKGFSRIFFAEYEGKIIAAENFGIYKNAAFYWTGAASELGLNLEGNSLIQWKAIQLMIDEGLEWYETGEAFPNIKGGKLKGLNDFKKSFGGELYPYYRGRLDTRSKKYIFLDVLKEIKNMV